ncbi:hypothetical protein [Eubacterium callanderi]|uniref:hypothetical protein n=1 Tax=Eubacterium callanderi TaxID=53442 RepID=UPI0026713272|nr:hypothetical protein [Eubacterium callanderi]
MLRESVLFTGTQNLLNDLTTILLVLAPIIAIVLLIVFSILKSGANEMDEVKWGKRQRNVVICLIVAMLASTIIKLILNYYGVQ